MYDYAFALDGNNTTTKESMRPSLYRFLTDFQNTNSYRLMMAHRPDSFIFGDAAKTWDIDLVVSGHNHGGQVILPVLGESMEEIRDGFRSMSMGFTILKR